MVIPGRVMYGEPAGGPYLADLRGFDRELAMSVGGNRLAEGGFVRRKDKNATPGA